MRSPGKGGAGEEKEDGEEEEDNGVGLKEAETKIGSAAASPASSPRPPPPPPLTDEAYAVGDKRGRRLLPLLQRHDGRAAEMQQQQHNVKDKRGIFAEDSAVPNAAAEEEDNLKLGAEGEWHADSGRASGLKETAGWRKTFKHFCAAAAAGKE